MLDKEKQLCFTAENFFLDFFLWLKNYLFIIFLKKFKFKITSLIWVEHALVNSQKCDEMYTMRLRSIINAYSKNIWRKTGGKVTNKFHCVGLLKSFS